MGPVLQRAPRAIGEVDVALVHQGRRAEGVVGPLFPQQMVRDATEFIIHTGEQAVEGLFIALSVVVEQLRNRGGFIHKEEKSIP
jgi:hypothetical protein